MKVSKECVGECVDSQGRCEEGDRRGVAMRIGNGVCGRLTVWPSEREGEEERVGTERGRREGWSALLSLPVRKREVQREDAISRGLSSQ